MASYKEALTIKSNLAEIHNNLGVTMQRFGRFDEAEDCYVQALKLKRNYPQAIQNILDLLAIHTPKGNLSTPYSYSR